MGMEDADGIAILSFIMSFVSLGSNAYIGLREAGFIAHEGKGSEAAAARRQSLKDYMVRPTLPHPASLAPRTAQNRARAPQPPAAACTPVSCSIARTPAQQKHDAPVHGGARSAAPTKRCPVL